MKESAINRVSKAHAEANSMLAFAAALLLDMVAFWDSAQLNKKWAFFFLAYFLAMTGARIYARDRKIRELYPPPSGSNAGDQA